MKASRKEVPSCQKIGDLRYNTGEWQLSRKDFRHALTIHLFFVIVEVN